MKKIEKITINVPIFTQRIFISASTKDTRVIEKFLSLRKGELSDLQGVDAIVKEYELAETGEVAQVICLREGNDRTVIMHECNHAAVNLCELYGIPIAQSCGGKRGDEAFAYISSWLYKAVCKTVGVES